MSAKNAHELKQLQTRLAKAETEEKSADQEIRAAQRKKEQAAKLCENLRRQITAIQNNRGTVVVTEHALLRYFERVMGFDLGAIRRELTPPGVVQIVTHLPNGRIPHPEIRCRLVVVDGVIVTLETDE